jgi:glycerol-3-phosphate dehydrogenase
LIVERTGFQSTQMLDMLVVDAGINGIGIARDATGRGLPVRQD